MTEARGFAVCLASSLMSVFVRERGTDVLRPLSSEHADDESFEGLLIVQPQAGLLFANAQDVSEKVDLLAEQHPPTLDRP